MIQRQVREKKCVCDIHKVKAVQLGSCLTCSNRAAICETKGCIGFHQENQRAHNVLTLQQIRHIVSQYINSNIQKRSYLKKMVYEYFAVARRQVQRIFTEVYDSIDNFVFDDLIFHQDDKRLIDLLIQEDYQKFSCEEIATILPKMMRSTDYQDGHFTHLRNYLIAQKEKVTSGLNSLLLNLPEFRFKSTSQNTYKFYQIAQQSLKDVNTQLINLSHRPKKLRIKYVDDEVKLHLDRLFKAKKCSFIDQWALWNRQKTLKLSNSIAYGTLMRMNFKQQQCRQSQHQNTFGKYLSSQATKQPPLSTWNKLQKIEAISR